MVQPPCRFSHFQLSCRKPHWSSSTERTRTPRCSLNPALICSTQGYCCFLIVSFNWVVNFFCLMFSSWPPSKQINTWDVLLLHKSARQFLCLFPKQSVDLGLWTCTRKHRHGWDPATSAAREGPGTSVPLHSSDISQICSPDQTYFAVSEVLITWFAVSSSESA